MGKAQRICRAHEEADGQERRLSQYVQEKKCITREAECTVLILLEGDDNAGFTFPGVNSLKSFSNPKKHTNALRYLW